MGRTDFKWYTYELIDPRNRRVFYIGKGCGDRCLQHERDVKRGICSNPEKTKIIKNILEKGLSVEHRKLAYFSCEKAAYEHESALIQTYKNLTNIRNTKNIVHSFYDVVYDIFFNRIPLFEMTRRLSMFRMMISHSDHKRLFELSLKHIKNQELKGKVHGW